jgi:1,4-alpha-glucan branching enzyme
MPLIPVHFEYRTGLRHIDLRNARLTGSWDGNGQSSEQWSTAPMQAFAADDGCAAFRATAMLDDGEIGRSFRWSVIIDTIAQASVSAIPTEVNDTASTDRHRVFTLVRADQTECYYLTTCRRLGANKLFVPGRDAPALRFAVWAPNARSVELVRSRLAGENNSEGGYIWDDGRGVSAVIPMHRDQDGVWSTDLADSPDLVDFRPCDHTLYMFRVTKDDGSVAYRTDLYSRCQIGSGAVDPAHARWNGRRQDLDGTVSCSVVVDPERVTKYFAEEPPYMPDVPPEGRVWPERHFIDAAEFWKDEFTDRKLPRRVEDLVIYELHVGALGFGNPGPGTLANAIALLDHLQALGVNAVELLPMSEFGGRAENWGYATSHYFAIEFGGGGRDQYKFFIKEAHRRGIAVIMDVVYNHYAHEAERAEWMYDSNAHERNIYYWYVGNASEYPNPINGYVENLSTADAPRYHEEMVRKLFISSAAALMLEFHIDGFRVDQTTSIHSYNRQRIAGAPQVSDANIFGGKLLREFSRTLRLLKPEVIITAEDHSTWDELTRPVEFGGVGFDARWYSDFCHHLAGDTKPGDMSYAKLLYASALLENGALRMDWFAGALGASGFQHIVYHESHDEAGNSDGPFYDPEYTRNVEYPKTHTSHRAIRVAVNDAPLTGDTRRYAEARCRFAYALTVFSAGTPMLFFGEEVGAERRFKYDAVLRNKENLLEIRGSYGANLFRFYAEATRLRIAESALRSRNIEVLHTHNDNRVIAFRRWDDSGQFLIAGSLNNRPFANRYWIGHGSVAPGRWQEVFNSDGAGYGGDNVGNLGAVLASDGTGLNVVIPANGVVVFRRLGG